MSEVDQREREQTHQSQEPLGALTEQVESRIFALDSAIQQLQLTPVTKPRGYPSTSRPARAGPGTGPGTGQEQQHPTPATRGTRVAVRAVRDPAQLNAIVAATAPPLTGAGEGVVSHGIGRVQHGYAP